VVSEARQRRRVRRRARERALEGMRRRGSMFRNMNPFRQIGSPVTILVSGVSNFGKE